MSQHQVLDPRLGPASLPPPPRPLQYGDVPAPQPHPPSFSLGLRPGARNEEVAPPYRDPQQSPSQPYYYPTPQDHTPQGSGAGVLSGPSSNASPNDQIAHPQSPDNQDGSGNPDDPKRPRACEACRGLKVRCDQDPEHPEVPCKRCAKAGRQCVITQPSRKRQKKADSRVAELEKKLDALTAVLHHQQQGGPSAALPEHVSYGAQEADMRPRGSTSSVSTHRHPGVYPLMSGQPSATPSYGAKLPSDSPVGSHKRRRTNDEKSSLVTPALGGVDVSVANPTPRTMSQAGSPNCNKDTDFRLNHQLESLGNTWNPTQDVKRFLYATSPDEFEGRINSLISPDMASSIFSRYVTNLSCHLPAVVFPPGTTAQQVLQEKPILYVCILSTCSFGTLPHDVTRQLSKEAVGAIADCVVRNGAKSLELIQAMQVIALWYKPPEQAEQTNFYQIIHMAAIMALDIGLGKRFNAARARRGFGGRGANLPPGARTAAQDSDTVEARRAWLCCYYLCASSSMVLRRPNLIRWTNYMKECIEVLETSPDAAPTDRFFVQHVKIQHVCEEIGLQFLMDDSSANISISDPKVTYALSVLESQLKTWNEQIPPDLRTPGLEFFYHVTSLYLHEIALHFNHNIDDFRMPFTEESLKSVNNTADTLTQSQMAALEACLKAAHGILDTILGYCLDVIKSLPILLYFVRCIYSIVILVKMHVAVTTPGSELGKIMKAEDLRVEHYLDGLIEMFSYVTKEEARPHPKMLHILGILRDWFIKHKESVAKQQAGEQPAALQSTHNQYGNSGQTPLHLLSQVATDSKQNQQPHSAAGADHQDWTFNSPNPIPYSIELRTAASAPSPYTGASDPYNPENQGTIDPTNPNQDFGWGSGFEQAMDITLGGMDGLAGGELNNWFLGDSTAPFQFSVEHGGGMGAW